MAKAGMRRPDSSDPHAHGTENYNKTRFRENTVEPVPEIQGKAKTGIKKHNYQGVNNLPKDSQPDNKRARKEKSKGQTTITAEAQNHNPNAKKHSVRNNDV